MHIWVAGPDPPTSLKMYIENIFSEAVIALRFLHATPKTPNQFVILEVLEPLRHAYALLIGFREGVIYIYIYIYIVRKDIYMK